MIREINFKKFAKARFWFNKIPDLFRINDSKEECIIINNNIDKSLLCREFMLELYIPFGAKIDYGILGIITQENKDKLLFELYKENNLKKIFQDSYSKLIDSTYIGLPDEYYKAIRNIIIDLESYSRDIPNIPKGKISVFYGAHSIVNSSANIFEQLFIVLLKMAFSDKSEFTDEELIKLMIDTSDAFSKRRESLRSSP
jgi:hypothetical protein